MKGWLVRTLQYFCFIALSLVGFLFGGPQHLIVGAGMILFALAAFLSAVKHTRVILGDEDHDSRQWVTWAVYSFVSFVLFVWLIVQFISNNITMTPQF